jgi:hypothetical protein
MIETQKLLYIFPDVAYVAELIPGKKEHTYSIQSFRQINGQFISETDLIAKNILKLLTKLNPDSYQLILPDFLFTNTIVEIKEKSENKVKEYIKNKLLPDLELDASTHHLKPFILNQYGDKSRIQLSAIEKSVLASVVKGAEDSKVSISAVAPLSWTLKSLISLEPSISIVQMGNQGYLALHYIGVDQTNNASTSEITTLVETIRTLKGAEPSIQTVYLLTDEEAEEKIKKELNDIVPAQQLTKSAKDNDIPNYVQQVIEAGMKSLSIPDYAVPIFNLPKLSEIESFLEEQLEAQSNIDFSQNSKDLEASTDDQLKNQLKDEFQDQSESGIQTNSNISTIISSNANFNPGQDFENNQKENEKNKNFKDSAEKKSSENSVILPNIREISLDDEFESKSDQDRIINQKPEDADFLNPTAVATRRIQDLPENENKSEKTDQPTTRDFGYNQHSPQNASDFRSDFDSDDKYSRDQIGDLSSNHKPVLKNKSVVKPMLKMFLIGLSVFFATIALGIAIGVGILGLNMIVPFMPNGFDLSNQSEFETIGEVSDQTVITTSPTPTPTPTPTPEPSPEPIDLESLSVLVVNATTKAGYAGTIQKSLSEVDFDSVTAGNAKGDYDSGLYLLINEEFEQKNGLLKIINEQLELKFELGDEEAKNIEDATGRYDVVVVLAE